MEPRMNWNLKQLFGVALIVATVTVPLTYCSIEDHRLSNELRTACINAKGNWSNLGSTCTLPKADNK